MPSPLASSRISAAVVGALVGTAAGILLVTLVTSGGTLSLPMSGPCAAVTIAVPALAGGVVGVAVTSGKARTIRSNSR